MDGNKWIREIEPVAPLDLGDPWEGEVAPEPKPETYRFRHSETNDSFEVEYVRAEQILRVRRADVRGAKLVRLVAPNGAAAQLEPATADDPFLTCRLDVVRVCCSILAALQMGDVRIELSDDKES